MTQHEERKRERALPDLSLCVLSCFDALALADDEVQDLA